MNEKKLLEGVHVANIGVSCFQTASFPRMPLWSRWIGVLSREEIRT